MNKIYIFKSTICLYLIPVLSYAQVMTVKGIISAEEMGISLIHEHVMVDWIGADSTGYQRWNRNDVVKRVSPFLKDLKKYGVRTFFDCTPAFLGRDPLVLKELAENTGLNIVTNTGYYGAQNNKFLPKWAFDASSKELANQWIQEFEKGIDTTGIRPGFIKISVNSDSTLSTLHKKLVRAAALTHLKTGMGIVSHTGPDAPALAQIEILKEMGVSPSAFVWTHAQNGTKNGFRKAAEQGAWISLDNVSDDAANIAWVLKTLSWFKKEKLLDHVLISHDSGWYTVGEENGGSYREHTSIFVQLIPELLKNGFTKESIDTLLIQNPKRAYSLNIRKL